MKIKWKYDKRRTLGNEEFDIDLFVDDVRVGWVVTIVNGESSFWRRQPGHYITMQWETMDDETQTTPLPTRLQAMRALRARYMAYRISRGSA